MRFKWLVATALVASVVCGAEPKYNGQIKAEEVHARDGIGNVLAKIKQGQKEIVVAYLGGSITAMSGWRNLTTDWLRTQYPNVKFKEIHASIGGTGSELGAYRLQHDALQYKPDLLFVEFATNDSGCSPSSIWRSMEGIVRQTWRQDSKTDIVFTYTICQYMMGDYGKGMCTQAASAMDQLADYYGIPSICFGPRVAAEVKAGRMVMSQADAAKETAVPVETPERDKVIAAKLAKEGKILFATDGVHPAMPGHGFYLKSIQAGWKQMENSKPFDHAQKMATPFVANNMEHAKMVEITPDMLTGRWEKLPATDNKMRYFSNRMGQIWAAETPGASIHFKFRGTSCMMYDLLGPDGGQVWVTMDGVKRSAPTARFDSYCTYHRIATLWLYQGADGEHEVTIEVDKNQPSRKSVAFRLKDPEKELATEKYQGTKFWPAKIMLIGDLVM